MATAYVRGKAFDSADVKITAFGIEEEEVKEISYSDQAEHQLNHSLSTKATSWSMGKETYSFTLTLYMAAVVKLQDASRGSDGTADLKRIKPFPVPVTYANDDNETITDIVYGKFQGQGRQVNGEMGLAYQFEMFCVGIDWHKRN